MKQQIVWVVEAFFKYDRIWEPCNFADMPYFSTNYYEAHELKRKIQTHLQVHGSKDWYKNRFRVSKCRRIR